MAGIRRAPGVAYEVLVPNAVGARGRLKPDQICLPRCWPPATLSILKMFK